MKSGVQREDISNSHSSWERAHSTEPVSYLCCSSCTSCSGHAGPMQTPPGGWGSDLRVPSPAETTIPRRKGFLFVLKKQKTSKNSSLCSFKIFLLTVNNAPIIVFRREKCSKDITQSTCSQTLTGLADISKMAKRTEAYHSSNISASIFTHPEQRLWIS